MSENKYKNILLVGASGQVGTSILANLLVDTNFNITVLLRIGSSAQFPSNVNIIQVNYSDKTALVKAMTDQDVVISVVGGEGLIKNIDRLLIEAALEANVKWFIPSEYGLDLDHPAATSIPINIPAIENVQLLEKTRSQLAYTCISTGAFIDWGLDNGFLCFDIKNHTATLFDEGKHFVSGTLLENLGQIIVAVLHHPELCLNKRIYMADTRFTQQEVLTLLEKYTNTKWTIIHTTTEETLRKGHEEWLNENHWDAYISFVLGLAYSGTDVCDFKDKTNNEIFGLKTISLEQIIKEAVQRNHTH